MAYTCDAIYLLAGVRFLRCGGPMNLPLGGAQTWQLVSITDAQRVAHLRQAPARLPSVSPVDTMVAALASNRTPHSSLMTTQYASSQRPMAFP